MLQVISKLQKKKGMKTSLQTVRWNRRNMVFNFTGLSDPSSIRTVNYEVLPSKLNDVGNETSILPDQPSTQIHAFNLDCKSSEELRPLIRPSRKGTRLNDAAAFNAPPPQVRIVMKIISVIKTCSVHPFPWSSLGRHREWAKPSFRDEHKFILKTLPAADTLINKFILPDKGLYAYHADFREFLCIFRSIDAISPLRRI